MKCLGEVEVEVIAETEKEQLLVEPQYHLALLARCAFRIEME